MGKNVRRTAGFPFAALTAGALLAGCAPPPGGIGSAPQAGAGDTGNAAPGIAASGQPSPSQSSSDQSGSSQPSSDQSGSGRSSSPSATSKSADRVVVKTGEGSSRGEVEPEKLRLGTADGTKVEDIEWSSWGGGRAVGEGTLKVDGGARGSSGGSYENASITLRVPKTYSGDKQYTRYTVSAPGLPNAKANPLKFQPTNHVVQEAEQANEVYVTQGGGPRTRPEQRPIEFTAGGVGHMRMENVDWTSWNGPTAVGRGTLVINGCRPSCADGGTDNYADGTVRLSEVKNVSGKKQYTKFTMTAPGLPQQQAEILTDQPID